MDSGKVTTMKQITNKEYEEWQKSPGNYSRSFFPVAELLRKEAENTPCKFSPKFLEEYTKEDEYITRVNLNCMYVCKWQSI